MREIEVVHVVFKTHLDIGFTDLAENVTNQYIQSYIPKAIELSRELEKEKDSAGFVWTTGSWLIHEYLKRANADEKRSWMMPYLEDISPGTAFLSRHIRN
ncbi:hypothetical protein MGI18_26755 [Bacillus sp. OVS6]|nr:hypothetical protein MGI18_26755 [Bacillus sp. OVS6]